MGDEDQASLSPIPDGAWERRGEKDIRDLIILHYWPMLTRVVGRIRQSLPPHVRIDEDDLRSFGLIGLYKALDRFDPSLGHPFDKYASNFVRGAVLDGLRSMDWAPRSLRKRQKDLDLAVRTLTAELGRDPAEWEVAEHLKWTTHDISMTRKQIDTAWPRSLDAIRGQADQDMYAIVANAQGEIEEHALSHVASPEDDPSRILNDKLLQDITQGFTPQKKAVLVFCYFLNMRLSEVAPLLGLSEAKVSSLHQEVLASILAKMTELLE